jgi:polysaccharide transporter, PST family
MITRNILKILPQRLRVKLSNNREFRRILGNINWLTFESIFKNLVGVFVFALVARYLGPEQFGLMSYALAFVALFSFLSSLGLEGIFVRDIVSNPDKKAEYLGSTFFLKILGSLTMVFVVGLAIFIVEPENQLIQLFVVILTFSHIFKSFYVIDLWFQSKVQSKYSVYSRSSAFFIISLTKITLILVGAPLVIFIMVMALEAFLVSVFLIYFYSKRGEIAFRKWKIKIDVMKALLKDSWPLMLSSIAIIIYMRLDQIMIGNIMGEAQVGIYSAAVKISEAWYIIPGVITTSVFPSIISTCKKNKKSYLKKIQILYDGFLWFTIPSALIITLIAPFIINLLYGTDYALAANILSVHIWAGIFVFWGYVNGKYLIVENHTKIMLKITVIGAILNIILNLILINLFGAFGAAIATLISQIFTGTILIYLFTNSRLLFKMQVKAFNVWRILKYFK